VVPVEFAEGAIHRRAKLMHQEIRPLPPSPGLLPAAAYPVGTGSAAIQRTIQKSHLTRRLSAAMVRIERWRLGVY
jgi:hypothetical protein